MRRLFCPIFLVLCLVQQAELLFCYTCSSIEISGCGDPFNYTALKNDLAYCDPLRNLGWTYFCAKEVYQTSSGFHYQKQFKRRCKTDHLRTMHPGVCPDFHVHEVDANTTQITCEICNYDACNRSTMNAKPNLTYLFHTTLPFLLIKLNLF